jgi:amino acid adenylation domain-containing protein
MQKSEIEDVYQLSPLQQGMLFHNLYQHGDDVYVVQFRLTLLGPLHPRALEEAWDRVLAEHPVLRSSFHWEKLQAPSQVVHRRVKLPIEVHDWRGREADLESFLEEDRARGFDLTQAPLMRLSVLRTGPEEHLLVWTHHHLLLDGWSVALVVGQVLTLYEALARGESRDLERARPFREYIAWLRRQDLGEAERFWRQELAGFTAPTPLGSREPLPGRTGSGDLTVRLPPAATAALQALAREHQLTVNTLAQGAWALLLSRWSGEDDVLFGVTVSGRPAPLPGVEAMVGLFINTLPLRVKVEPDATLVAWLRRLQERQTVIRQYEHSPLFEVQGWSEAPRGTPLFHSLFVFENFPTAAERRAGPTSVEIRDLRLVEATNYPLSIAVTPGAELALRPIYDRSRFHDAEILRLLGHLATLFEGFAANPGGRLSELEVLTGPERHQTLVEWNDTAGSFPDLSLHRLFEEQVARAPAAPAVTCGDRTLTYGELNRWANRLAGHLRALGVGPESLVGLMTERSPEMIAGLLAILKAGGAYLPLDPIYPQERLAFFLADSEAPLVLAQPALAHRVPAGNARVIPLHPDPERLPEGDAGFPEDGPEDGLGADARAYVIYTSGSTGRPKGVDCAHRGIGLRVRPGRRKTFEAGPDDAWLQLTSLSFDPSVFEIWGALANGGRLVVYPPETPSPDGIAETVRRHGVTILWLSTGLFHQLVERGVGDLTRLRQLETGGDVVSAAHAEEALRQLPGVPFVNSYGPTENAVLTSCHHVTSPVGPTVPIGRPLPGTRVHLLDAHLRPVPAGTPGRLFAAGRGLARGYLRRPELTAERFVPDPFADLQGEPGDRLYDTGDLARWRPDGLLEFLGRSDAQVKIRGYRVEPGEVEAVLARHPAVKDAAVLAREDRSGGRRLVAYVVPHGEIAPAALRSWLAERLPAPMIPSAFVTLAALPFTPNGKLDRRALPEPEPGAGGPEGSRTSPRTPTEEVVEGIWAEVLGVERIGIEESFFDRGGHSLSAMQVVSRIRKTFGVELPLSALFAEPTVAALARRVEDLRRTRESVVESPLIPVPRGGDFPLSFAQQRLWFLDQLEPGRAAYNIPIALRLRGELDTAALAGALAALVARHEPLRTTFPSRSGEPAQRISPERPSMNRIDLRGLPPERREDEAGLLAREEALAPFNLARGPLLRSRLLDLGRDDHLLLLAIHHIVSDGWSMGVMVRDVVELYRSSSGLPELPVQYADYAVWQRRQLQGEALEARLSHWRERLAGAPAVLDLPADRPRPAVRSGRGAGVPLALPPDLSARLRAFGRRHGATLHMTWLAALAALLHRYGCGSDLPLGTTVANRDRPELEELIGFFVNTLVLRVDASGDPAASELVKRSRETALSAYSRQDLPFERLVEELHPERNLSSTPLFQVLLTVQNAPTPPVELPGLRVSPLRQPVRTARFDLALTVLDTEPGLSGNLTVATDLFDAATARRMLDHLAVLLDGMAGSPTLRLSELPLATGAELAQVLTRWSGTAAAASVEIPVHERFEQQAEHTPDAAAVRFGDRRLTFRELDARADALAHRLRALGVGPEQRVGLCAELSPHAVIGLLGILKAGGAFVPADPYGPAERRDFLLADAGVRVAVTSPASAEALAGFGGERVVVDLNEPLQGEGRVLSRTHPANLAYVLYTSGSTGDPKGVGVEHRQLAAYLGFVDRVLFGEQVWSCPLVTPLTFDASLKQVFGPLLRGEEVWGLGGETVDPAALVAELSGLQGVAFNGTPSLWAVLLEEIERSGAALPGLARLLLGGERLSPELFARTAAALPGAEVWNLYGPTEATANATSARLAPGGPVTLGRPIDGARVRLLDRSLQPVPPGVPGEICLGGAGVARGYLGRPELTAERFLPDPFATEAEGGPGARLYRTGDLGRFTANGEIEFLGRTDHQVKIRGVRIEPGEVEAVLARLPGAGEVAVVAVGEPEPRLVAWVSGSVESDLRAWLRDRLPAPMIPADFVTAPGPLPRLPSGKVDRQALARLAPRGRADREGFVPPRTPIEELLAAIWSEVLRVERVGAHDDFFSLSGHSLLATQVASRVREAFGVELPLARLFDRATLADLALEIESLQSRESTSGETGIVPVPRDRPLPATFYQEWGLGLEGIAKNSLPRALRLRGPLDFTALRRSLTEIARRHEALRTSFRWEDGEARFVLAPPGEIRIPLIDLAALPEERRGDVLGRRIAELAGHEFNLERGPLFLAWAVRLGDRDHALLLNVHHLVADGWSLQILQRELAVLYAAFTEGRPSPLPPLPVQLADFAHWQRRVYAGEALAAQLAWWRQTLADLPPRPALPFTRPPSQSMSRRAARFDLALAPELARELRTLARESGCSLSMVLLAAIDALLHRYSGQEDLIVSTIFAARNRPELSGSIGLFMNTVPVRVGLSGNPTFRELAARVRNALLAAYAHQDLPFPRVLAELFPGRPVTRTMLSRVSFNLLSYPTEAASAAVLPGGLALEPLAVGEETAKHDLSFVFRESQGLLQGVVTGAADLFLPGGLAELARDFEAVLARAVSDPDVPIGG